MVSPFSPTTPDVAAHRKNGLAVGAILLTAGAVAAFRGHPAAAAALAACGALGVGLAVAFPARLRGLTRLLTAVGQVNTFLLLTVAYLALITPLALVRRLTGGAVRASGWHARPTFDPQASFPKQY